VTPKKAAGGKSKRNLIWERKSKTVEEMAEWKRGKRREVLRKMLKIPCKFARCNGETYPKKKTEVVVMELTCRKIPWRGRIKKE